MPSYGAVCLLLCLPVVGLACLEDDFALPEDRGLTSRGPGRKYRELSVRSSGGLKCPLLNVCLAQEGPLCREHVVSLFVRLWQSLFVSVVIMCFYGSAWRAVVRMMWHCYREKQLKNGSWHNYFIEKMPFFRFLLYLCNPNGHIVPLLIVYT